MSREWFAVGMAVIVTLASTAGVAGAQDRWDPPKVFLDMTFIAAEPVGDFAQNVDNGWGFEFGVRTPMDAHGILSMRLDMGFINYGHERLYGCSFTCRVGVDVQTNNNILFVGIGPELAVPVGPVRPYAAITGGLGYFLTTSTIGHDPYFDDHGSSTNFDDAVFQWRAQGGVRFQVSRGGTPVFLDFGGEYHRNGVVDYLREGDIVDEPDGSITLYVNRGEANLWTLRMGVSIGVGGHHHADRRGRGH